LGIELKLCRAREKEIIKRDGPRRMPGGRKITRVPGDEKMERNDNHSVGGDIGHRAKNGGTRTSIIKGLGCGRIPLNENKEGPCWR